MAPTYRKPRTPASKATTSKKGSVSKKKTHKDLQSHLSEAFQAYTAAEAKKKEINPLLRARAYFNNQEIRILTSPWGKDRLQELCAEKNTDERVMCKIQIQSLEDVLYYKERMEMYEKDPRSKRPGPNIIKDYKASNVIARTLREGKELPPQALNTGLASSHKIADNEFAQQLFAKIEAYNETVTGDYKIVIQTTNDIEAMLKIASNKDNLEIETPMKAKSAALQKMVTNVLDELSLKANREQQKPCNNSKSKHSNNVLKFPTPKR